MEIVKQSRRHAGPVVDRHGSFLRVNGWASRAIVHARTNGWLTHAGSIPKQVPTLRRVLQLRLRPTLSRLDVLQQCALAADAETNAALMTVPCPDNGPATM